VRIAKQRNFSLDSVFAQREGYPCDSFAARLSVNNQIRSLRAFNHYIAIEFIFGRIDIVPLAVCPECEAEIHVDEDADKGEIINCEECEARLEVVGLDPIELDLAPQDEEEDIYEDEDDF
jgi:alpha-aminoadipate carrier protein LysW